MPSTPSPQQPPPPDTGGTSGAGSPLDPALAARLKRNADGLLPAVAQQYDTGEVLMLGWMDDEALHRTLTTGRCTYWSRSRGEYWVKGDTSGHFQHVKSVALDCDGDTLLVRVDQIGAACHTGDRTCFDADPLPVSAPADTADTADTGAGGAGAAGARTTGDTAGAGTGSGAGQPTEDAARHRAEGVDATEERA